MLSGGCVSGCGSLTRRSAYPTGTCSQIPPPGPQTGDMCAGRMCCWSFGIDPRVTPVSIGAKILSIDECDGP